MPETPKFTTRAHQPQPRTADGVEIVEGKTVWLHSRPHNGIVERDVSFVSRTGVVYLWHTSYSPNPKDLYADKARAEAALKLHTTKEQKE